MTKDFHGRMNISERQSLLDAFRAWCSRKGHNASHLIGDFMLSCLPKKEQKQIPDRRPANRPKEK